MTTPDEKTFATLTKLFEEEFGPIGDRQVLYVHAPGRSEISGNHTDHEVATLSPARSMSPSMASPWQPIPTRSALPTRAIPRLRLRSTR